MGERQMSDHGRMLWLRAATRAAIILMSGLAVASAAPPARVEPSQHTLEAPAAGELAVLTYNVKGLPWPAASDRNKALILIGQRLAAMRRQGTQPGVVVLQEAFTLEAKAISRAAGYAWHVEGPGSRPQPGNPVGGSWYLGETQAALLDSGLAVLSDYPVLAVERAAFPVGACAGFDCLAAKGVLLVTIDLPGTGPVTVAVTHFNSRKASGVAFARANAAYNRQAAFLGDVLRKRRLAPEPLIVAGDFNRGDRPSRIAALDAELDPTSNALEILADAGRLEGPDQSDFATIRRRGRDLQFATNGRTLRIDPVAAHVPFGTEPGGVMLSDHLGFVVRYQLTKRPFRFAANTR